MNDALEVACPTCRQPVGRWCRTRITDRPTDIHMPRYDLRYRPTTTDTSPSEGAREDGRHG